MFLLLITEGYLVEAMKDKMKNIRNAKPRQKKAHENEESSILAKKQKVNLPFPRYPVVPIIPPSEDEASCARHIKFLQLEYQKVSPDKHIINSLMDRTYPFRRQEILQCPKPIQQILKVYPPITKIDQVSYIYIYTYVYRYTYTCIYVHSFHYMPTDF